MAKRARPAQGPQTKRGQKYPKTQPAGGDNVRISGVRRVNNNQKRRAT